MCQSAKASLTFYEQINSVLNTLHATLGESLFGPNGFVSNMQLKKKMVATPAKTCLLLLQFNFGNTLVVPTRRIQDTAAMN